MIKKSTSIFLFLLFLGLSSFSFHKFYVSIYQVDFVAEKKRVEITARIFMDDLNLAFGTIRIKAKGSDGGHNGLKNIQLELNSTEYPRFRFGISDAFKKGQQVNYVLGEWDEEEKEKLKERLSLSAEIVKSFALAGLNNTMNEYNGK